MRRSVYNSAVEDCEERERLSEAYLRANRNFIGRYEIVARLGEGGMGVVGQAPTQSAS